MTRAVIRLTALVVMSAAAASVVSCTSETRPVSAVPASAAPAPPCAQGEALGIAFDSGSAWSLCWGVDPRRGLVLTDIRFTPTGGRAVLVAKQLALAQLEVPYDTGERTTYDLTEAGFGSAKMQTLTETECLGERIATDIPDIGDGTFGDIERRPVLCAEDLDGGIAYRSADGPLQVDRRREWRLSTISKVGWYEYISEYSFGSDGVIRSRLGATGDISPFDFTDHDHGAAVGEGDTAHAASHAHNAVWRVHWALDDPGALAVEQYDAAPTSASGTESRILDGTLQRIPEPTTAAWVDRRWWRVVAPDVRNADGHPISYQIELDKSDSFVFTEDHARGGTDGYDVAFTNADDCELLAARNSAGCGAGVPDYVAAGAGESLRDVVSWIAVGFHHVVRDEDQSPMDVHWQGFALIPRDVTAQRVGVPDAREAVNGVPDNAWTELDEDENGG
ncbi:copper amine oxidase [Microbacterium sp. NPDC096154]|uniref:copper amine oxidase n=1 Tax=Microbacterium sp. NPDC096154 TaxID=3155549 RepID=UPI0033222D36